jgi:hypothetical protein
MSRGGRKTTIKWSLETYGMTGSISGHGQMVELKPDIKMKL